MATSTKHTENICIAPSTKIIYPPPSVMKRPAEDRPTTTESIKLQIVSDKPQTIPTPEVNLLFAVRQTTSGSEDEQTWVEISKTANKTEVEQSQSDIAQEKKGNRADGSDEFDAILARKMSSLDFNSGAKTKRQLSISPVVEEEPKWRDIGEFEVLRRTKCRRLYSKIGKTKDLALFYRSGKFYAMEAWCSHMGGPLFEGDIEDHNGKCHVMCPWHAYMFELSTGKSDIGLEQQVYPVKSENGRVFVEYTCPLALYPYL